MIKKYPIVYSYKLSRTRELELSLESLKNINEWNGDVYVIGDKPRLDSRYAHLPIKFDWGKKSGFKSSDEICAYLTAADSLDEFIIMADDIYVFKPWSLEFQNRGTLTDHIKTRPGLGIDYYTQSLVVTRDYLLSNGKHDLSYEIHIPILVKSTQLKEAAEIVKNSGKPLLIRSLICNWFNIPSIRSEDPKNIPINQDTILYSSHDPTFNYEEIRSYIK